MKPASAMDTVRFESDPPGAEAKTSNGQTCRTPCALALPMNAPLTVTFTLNGYRPESEKIELMAGGINNTLDDSSSPPQLQPNPVVVELTPAPAPSKPLKKPVQKKKTAAQPAAKPAARPKPAAARAAAPAATTSAPALQQGQSPWPATPQPTR
jgi:hypothetical protein